MKLLKPIPVLIAFACVVFLFVSGESTEQLSFFPISPKGFVVFNQLNSPENILEEGEVAYRFYVSQIAEGHWQTYISIVFNSESIQGKGAGAKCHLIARRYDSSEDYIEKRMLLKGNEAVSFLDALDKSEVFSLCEVQRRRHLAIEGCLVFAEQIDGTATKQVVRCEKSSVPMEYLLDYLRTCLNLEIP